MAADILEAEDKYSVFKRIVKRERDLQYFRDIFKNEPEGRDQLLKFLKLTFDKKNTVDIYKKGLGVLHMAAK